MRFNSHYLPQNRPHAFLSASKYGWIKYDEDKLIYAYLTQLAAQKGTELHAVAHSLIKHQIKLPDSPLTMNMYVNDAIGYQMNSEVVLFVSENCYGTADSIAYYPEKKLLRISDYKSGKTATSFNQLLVYAAMFCIEYRMKPFEIQIELRIYQNNEVRIMDADLDNVTHIMDKIHTFDDLIKSMREEAGF